MGELRQVLPGNLGGLRPELPPGQVDDHTNHCQPDDQDDQSDEGHLDAQALRPHGEACPVVVVLMPGTAGLARHVGHGRHRNDSRGEDVRALSDYPAKIAFATSSGGCRGLKMNLMLEPLFQVSRQSVIITPPYFRPNGCPKKAP